MYFLNQLFRKLGILGESNLQDLANTYVFLEDKSSFQKALFQIHIRQVTIPLLQSILVTLGALILLTWPTDYFYFQNPNIQNTYFVWRTISIIGISIFLIGLHYSSFLRKRLFVIMYLAVMGDIALTAFLFGQMKGLEAPWFYTIFVLPILTVFLLNAEIITRTISTALVPLVFAVAYFSGGYVFQPEQEQYFNYPYLDLILNLVLSIVIISIILGHIIYFLNRRNFFQNRLVQKNRQKIKHMADHDQLTGIYNRREFDNQAEEEFARCQRYERDLTFLMIDLDHFKEINDTYGHPVGDDVLECMGDLIQQSTRTADIAGRYGGEEFCLALPETDLEGAVILANRLRETLQKQEFEGPEGETFSVTCSIGAAKISDDTENHRDVLKQADEALYRAKEGGRNQVIKAESS